MNFRKNALLNTVLTIVFITILVLYVVTAYNVKRGRRQAFTIGCIGSGTIGENLMPDLAVNFFRKKFGKANARFITSEETSTGYIVEYKPDEGPIYKVQIDAHPGSLQIQIPLDDTTGTYSIGMASTVYDKTEYDESYIGLDGIGLYVNQPNKPINRLTLGQLADVFTKDPYSWRLISDKHAISGVVERKTYTSNSGTVKWFTDNVLHKIPLGKHTTDNDYPDLARFVSEDDSSTRITFFDSGNYYCSTHNNSHVSSALSIDWNRVFQLPISVPSTQSAYLLPTIRNIKSRTYPLTRELYLYTNPARIDPLRDEFIAFIMSDTGQSTMEEDGFGSRLITDNDGPTVGELHSGSGYPSDVDHDLIQQGAHRLVYEIKYAPGMPSADLSADTDLQLLVRWIRDHNTPKPKRAIHIDLVASYGALSSRSKALDRTDAIAQYLVKARALPIYDVSAYYANRPDIGSVDVWAFYDVDQGAR